MANVCLLAIYLVALIFPSQSCSRQHPLATLNAQTEQCICDQTAASDVAQGPMNGGVFAPNNTVAPKEQKIFPLFNNTGKTAIVTGAGAGIGLAVAQGLAESGANVAIW